MKKLLAALSAAGLVSLGFTSVLGATAANASVRPDTAFALAVSQTTGLSPTAPTPLTYTVTGASAGDDIEYGICNDDASNANPLVKPGQACTPLAFAVADASGDATINITLTPGKQGTSATSGCPVSSAQTGLGVQCIAAVADVDSGATADSALYFTPKAAKVTGTGGIAKIVVPGGFEVAGLVGSSPSTLTGPCQAFSGKYSAKKTLPWTTDPLCDDGANAPAGVGGPLAKGQGYAAGEAVIATIAGDEVGGAQANADAPTPATDPGGVTITLGSALPQGTYTVTLTGSGFTGGANASGVVINVTVKVAKSGKVT